MDAPCSSGADGMMHAHNDRTTGSRTKACSSPKMTIPVNIFENVTKMAPPAIKQVVANNVVNPEPARACGGVIAVV